LMPTAESYLAWESYIDQITAGRPDISKAAAYAIRGRVVPPCLEQIEAPTDKREAAQQRKERRDLRDACITLISVILDHLHVSTETFLLQDPEFQELIDAENARGLWEHIRSRPNQKVTSYALLGALLRDSPRD